MILYIMRNVTVTKLSFIKFYKSAPLEVIGVKISKNNLKQFCAKNKTTNKQKNILIKELKTN